VVTVVNSDDSGGSDRGDSGDSDDSGDSGDRGDSGDSSDGGEFFCHANFSEKQTDQFERFYYPNFRDFGTRQKHNRLSWLSTQYFQNFAA
jgi:hypothetical protein